MRILAIDWGNKRLGLAVSDYSGSIANPIYSLERKGDRADIEIVTMVVKEYEVEKIIVGIPLEESGKRGKSAEKAFEFAEKLKEALDVPVEMVDERYSTLAAGKSLLEGDLSRKRRKKLRDGVAAAWFLQTYLDREKLNRG
jgi:putative Holliday junction resolvase